MIELDANNLSAYLRDRHIIDVGEAATVQELGWGVSNVVLRVDTSQRSLVLKQSRAQLRTRAAWFSNLDRIFREADVMRALHARLPRGVVPEVVFEDRDNYVFAMTAAPADHTVWKQFLLDGVVNLAIGRMAGDILGKIHASTAADDELARQFSDNEVFVQLRVEPFYWRLRPRFPELIEPIDSIVDTMFRTRIALTHADFSPKNLLVHSGGVTLVDYETGHWGDPAFDLGFFLSHLILKSIKHDALRHQFFDLTHVFWDRYREQLRAVRTPIAAFRLDDLTGRAIGHFALCAIARIDGTSPVDYLPDELKRSAVRKIGRTILREAPGCWESVLEMTESELRLC